MAYLAALSLSNGMRVGLAAVAGIALGLSVYGIAAAFGLAALIDNSPLLYEALRWAGVVYLLWLAWDGWRSETASGTAAAAGAVSPAIAFRRGLVTNLLNPKAAIFYIAILPDFVRVDLDAVRAQTLALSAIYVCVATAVHLVIVLLAGTLQHRIDTPDKRRIVRRTLALLLVGIAAWFAVSTRR